MNAAERKFDALVQAVRLMRKTFHRMRRAIEAGEISEIRTRLSKQEIIDTCQWEYDWSTLLNKLVDKYGLIHVPTGPRHKAYTFKANVLSEIASGATHLLPDEADEFVFRLIHEGSISSPQTRKRLSGVSDSMALVAAKDYKEAKEYLESLGEYARRVQQAYGVRADLGRDDPEEDYDYGQGDPFAREGDMDEDEEYQEAVKPTEDDLILIAEELERFPDDGRVEIDGNVYDYNYYYGD